MSRKTTKVCCLLPVLIHVRTVWPGSEAELEMMKFCLVMILLFCLLERSM